MKKLISSFLCATLICSLSIPSFAAAQSAGKLDSEQYIIDTFGYYYELYDGDTEKATQALLDSKDSLVLISQTSYEENFLQPMAGYDYGEQVSAVRFTESIVHDSDWDTYVYNGTWGWTGVSNMTQVNPGNSLYPEDIIAVFSQNGERMGIDEIFLYGYDEDGSRTCYYNSQQPIQSYGFGKVLDYNYIRAFAFDESEVYRGRMSVVLSYDRSKGTTNNKIMMQYSHSWQEEETTGFGFEVGAGSFGLNASWGTNVYSWPGNAQSEGLRLPT